MQEPNVPHHFDPKPNDYPRRKTPAYGWRDDNGKPIHAIDEHGNPICGRRCNISGEPCRRKDHNIASNGRCTTIGHGGKAPGGPIKHGRYSIFLPTRLAATYEELAEGDVLRNVRENIAVLEAMTQHKIAEMGEDSSAELWQDAKKVLSEAVGAQEEIEVRFLLTKLAAVLNNGEGVQQKEREIIELMKTNGRLTKVEIARIKGAREYMTAKEMLTQHAHVIHVLQKYVDPVTLSKVSTELGTADFQSTNRKNL